MPDVDDRDGNVFAAPDLWKSSQGLNLGEDSQLTEATRSFFSLNLNGVFMTTILEQLEAMNVSIVQRLTGCRSRQALLFPIPARREQRLLRLPWHRPYQ